MSIIYQPQLKFNAREAIAGSVVKAGALAIADFVAQENKPWSYYLGAAFGNAALATGIIGAAATIYVIGDTLDFAFFKSPDGSDLRYFLNGVQLASLDTYAATSAWELVQNIVLAPNQVNELTIVNYAASTASGASGIAFLALGPLTIFGNNAFAFDGESADMVVSILNFRTTDSEQDVDFGNLPVYIPAGETIANLQLWADLFGPALDAAMDVKLTGIDVKISLGVNGAIKANPVALSLNERGGLISYDTSGDYGDSIWIPGLKNSLFAGSAVATNDALIAALNTLLTTQAAGANNIRPVTKNGFNWLTIRGGKKSIRK